MKLPQSERSEILKQMLKWLSSQEKGATLQALISYTKWEITEGGATDNTIKKYIQDLSRAMKIEYNQPFWKITEAGKEWMERYSI